MNAQYYKYIGKSSSNKDLKPNYHLLPYHSLDVAAVTKALLYENQEFTNDLAEFLDIEPKNLISLLCFFIAIHDLGKFSSAFQRLFISEVSTPLHEFNTTRSYDSLNFRHDRLGLHFWYKNELEVLQRLTNEQELDIDDEDEALESLLILVLSVLGHHGKPINEQNTSELRVFSEEHNEIASSEFIQELIKLFKPRVSFASLLKEGWRNNLKQISWHLAGLAVLADWLGSNTEFFPYETKIITLDEYWKRAQTQAEKALQATDVWRSINVEPFLSVKEHYGFEPTPLQHWAQTVEIDNSPQLYILEDITGSGKTEAALTITHRLMQSGAANGFYFGLPTMATSNAMFSRVANHYLQMLNTDKERKPSIVLAHGAREMNDLFRESIVPLDVPDSDYSSTDLTVTTQCNAWFSDSRKKALLAPVGVGTIDQALLAVLPRRHQSLRLLGLNRKVLVFDEVHSADEYMFELLESLLELHLHQGGSVVLLTATLSKKQRQRLITIWGNSLGLVNTNIQNTSFPLATKVSLNKGLEEFPLESREDLNREVPVLFLDSESLCIEKVLSSVNKGRCVVWIRNTVNDAFNAFQEIIKKIDNPEDCLLFHSRFTLIDRKRIEKKVLDTLGKKSNGAMRKGKVVVATQVFQESLDADVDVMISDICPIDDLIQRAGRLHRHTRNLNGKYERGIVDKRSKPVLYIHAPKWSDEPNEEWLSESFMNTEFVYRSPGRLWLAMKILKEKEAIRMPFQARQLIEAVYGEDAFHSIPRSLIAKEQKLLGEERSKAAKAQSGLIDWKNYGYCSRSGNGWYEDDTNISTRYSDIQTVEVVLVELDEEKQFVFYAKENLFSMSLSTVKLTVNKYFKKLNLIEENDPRLRKLKSKYPNINLKYLNLWDYKNDNECYGYNPHFGVYDLNRGGDK